MMSFRLPPVYPITDTRLSGLSLVRQAEQFIDGGAKLIQIRDKTASSRQLFDAVVAAMEVARGTGVKVIVNDRVDIALMSKADGVHLGQTDLPAEEARRILGPERLIGVSTHTLEQAELAARSPADMIAFGPIFATSTKEDPDPVTGLEQLANVRRIVAEMPLIAIGGITADNLGSVFQAGADSVAMIGSLFRNGRSIAETVAEMLQIAEQKRNC